MFNLYFWRNKDKAETSAVDLQTDRPSAGEIRVQGSNETLFLAPLPVYIGQPQIGSQTFSQMNEVFLEMGGNNRGMVESGKMLACQIWFVMSFVFGFPLFIGAFLALFPNPEIVRDIPASMMMAFQVSLLYGIPGCVLTTGAVVYGIVSDVNKKARSYPLRFNRQRREVCYVDSTTHRVLIVPWESVVAWVSNSQAVTSYGATRHYCFGMGLDDDEQDKVQFVLIPQFSDAHALGLWAAIRNYMEEGQLVDAPDPWLTALGLFPTGDRLKNYEGLHTFDIEYDDARSMGRLDDAGGDLSAEERELYGYSKRTPWPLRWWYVRRILTFWKMPFMLAEWGHRKGRPVFPEQVQAWSQPLPPEQWASPSPALQKATQHVRFAMDKQGATFTAACKEAGLH